MQSWLKLIWVELKIFLREPSVFFSLAFPIIIVIAYGSIFGNQPSAFYGGRGTVDVAVPTFTAMIIASSGLFSLPMSIAVYRERRILFRLQATPLRPQMILSTQFIVNFIMTSINTILLILIGKFAYNLHIDGNPFGILVAFTLCNMSTFALGFVLASLSPTARTTQSVGTLLFFVMLFLSGIAIPAQLFPPLIQRISQALPLTYVVSLLQGAWFGKGWESQVTNVLVLMVLLVAGVFVSAKVFRWR